jgi:hypothetical protein
MNLLYYNPIDLYSKENLDLYPVLNRTEPFKRLFNPSISLYDRTETIKWPVKIKNLYPMPNNLYTTKTFGEICNERMLDIIKYVKYNSTKQFVVMYSGGIDSTLLMVLLLQLGDQDIFDRTLVILNEASIAENPEFYKKYITKFRMASSNGFERYLTKDHIVLTGEFADNVFGSLTLGMVMDRLNDRTIAHAPYQDYALQFFTQKLNSKEDARTYMDIIEPVLKLNPNGITSLHDYMWWINFTMKWQAVEFRILSHAQPEELLDLDWVNNSLIHFWNTELWQQWAVSNPDKKVGKDWASYKWVAKELIYEFDRNRTYYTLKTKVPSLPDMVRFKYVSNFITEDMKFHKTLNLENFINV